MLWLPLSSGHIALHRHPHGHLSHSLWSLLKNSNCMPSCELPTYLTHYPIKLHTLLYSGIHSCLRLLFMVAGGPHTWRSEGRSQQWALSSPHGSWHQAPVIRLRSKQASLPTKPPLASGKGSLLQVSIPPSFHCLIPSLTHQLHRVLPVSLGAASPPWVEHYLTQSTASINVY